MPVVAIVGAGLIGVSFARLFAEGDWEVRVVDPRPDLDEIVARALPGRSVTTFADLAAGGEGVDFVQESGPERIEVKQEMFATLARVAKPDALLASSSSSLLPSAIAEGNPAADRILIGHPFNPPELMPLIELVPGPATTEDTLDRAAAVYRGLGKVPIRLKKEIPGFVGNRLQRALVTEANYLVQEGVIDVGDLDDLVKASLGLRWATIGPFESNHLGGGPGGIRELISHIRSQMRFDLGKPDPALMAEVIAAVEATYGTGQESFEALSDRRDVRTRAVLNALAETEPPADPS